MKRKWTIKRYLALMLTLVMLATALPVQALAEDIQPQTADAAPADAQQSEAQPEQADAPQAPAEDDGTTVYREVKFALPTGTTDEDVGRTTLPDRQMVEDGTSVNALPTAKQNGSVFLGWYYDEELTLLAGPDDKVDRNMTLYPRFGIREGLDDEFSYDYIADEDVAPDFAVLVMAHNLTPEDAAQRLAVRDITHGGEEVAFTVEPYGEPEPEAFSLDALDLDEETRQALDEALAAKAEDPEFVLTDALKALPLDADTQDRILEVYASDEWEAALTGWIDADALTLMQTAGLDLTEPGIPDLYAKYGLEEDDSPERYWREDLEMEPEDVLRLRQIVDILQEQA